MAVPTAYPDPANVDSQAHPQARPVPEPKTKKVVASKKKAVAKTTEPVAAAPCVNGPTLRELRANKRKHSQEEDTSTIGQRSQRAVAAIWIRRQPQAGQQPSPQLGSRIDGRRGLEKVRARIEEAMATKRARAAKKKGGRRSAGVDKCKTRSNVSAPAAAAPSTVTAPAYARIDVHMPGVGPDQTNIVDAHDWDAADTPAARASPNGQLTADEYEEVSSAKSIRLSDPD